MFEYLESLKEPENIERVKCFYFTFGFVVCAMFSIFIDWFIARHPLYRSNTQA